MCGQTPSILNLSTELPITPKLAMSSLEAGAVGKFDGPLQAKASEVAPG